jgi:hypothetical protein
MRIFLTNSLGSRRRRRRRSFLSFLVIIELYYHKKIISDLTIKNLYHFCFP